MALNPEGDVAGVAVLNGGPMDALPGGRSALVFAWAGRYDGPT